MCASTVHIQSATAEIRRGKKKRRKKKKKRRKKKNKQHDENIYRGMACPIT